MPWKVFCNDGDILFGSYMYLEVRHCAGVGQVGKATTKSEYHVFDRSPSPRKPYGRNEDKGRIWDRRMDVQARKRFRRAVEESKSVIICHSSIHQPFYNFPSSMRMSTKTVVFTCSPARSPASNEFDHHPPAFLSYCLRG